MVKSDHNYMIACKKGSKLFQASPSCFVCHREWIASSLIYLPIQVSCTLTFASNTVVFGFYTVVLLPLNCQAHRALYFLLDIVALTSDFIYIIVLKCCLSEMHERPAAS